MNYLSEAQLNNLYQSIGFTYRDQPRFEVELGPRQMEDSHYYRSYRLDFEMLQKDWAQQIAQAYLAPMAVWYLGEGLGYGLFAQRDFQPGEWIGLYSGVVRRARGQRRMKDALGGFSSDYAWSYPVRKGLRSLELDGRLEGNLLRFVNHSFEPNLRMEHCLGPQGWILFMLTEKSIQRGQQFTINYGEDYWVGGKRELILL